MALTDSSSQQFDGCPVLVTGGAGSIGGNLVRRLLELGASVTVLDDFSAAGATHVAASEARLIVGDICDPAKVAEAFAARPAIVFHLAASFANQRSLEDPEHDLHVNGLGTLRLLQRAAQAPVQRFVYTSSSSVYGSQAQLPLQESSCNLQSETPYQATKLLGELYGNCYHKRYGVPVVITRLFNAYGPGELPGLYRNVIPRFIYRALKDLPLPVFGSGGETRDFTYIQDVVDGLLLAALAPEAVGETINLGSGQATSIFDLAQTVIQLTGSSAQPVMMPRRSWDSVIGRVADIRKAKRLLGYEPQYALRQGLVETINWMRTMLPQIDQSLQLAQT